MNERKVILYIACSLDGYIAKPNDDLSFLAMVEQEGEDYGYHAFVESVDTVILGRRTYDWVMAQVPEFPHADKETYVISRSGKATIGKTQFYSGDLQELLTKLKQKEGKNIFVDGGAQVVSLLLKDKLIDEFIISIIPVLLGEGTRLFQENYPEQQLEFISNKAFPSGLLQMHYRRKIEKE